MLIKSLKALDFRKYSDLSINDIPEKGVISVSGANESGKTSIGEAICFALFGRTFVLDEENIIKLIRWGKDRAEVSLLFVGSDDQEYRLTRTISKSSGKLVDANTDTDAEKDIANNNQAVQEAIHQKDGSDAVTTVMLEKISASTSSNTNANTNEKDESGMFFSGTQQVAEALGAVIGFDYSAFANSFYLVQRELTAPDPNSHTIKQMAGIGDYARISDDLINDQKETIETLQEVNPQCAELEAQISEINLDETWLPELIEGAETLESEQRDKARLLEALDDGVESYANNIRPFKSAQRIRSFFGFLSVLLLPLVILSWVLWGLLRYSPETLMNLFAGNFADLLSGFSQWANHWLLPTAIILSLLLLLGFFLRFSTKRKMAQLNEIAGDFSRHLNTGYRHVTTEVETLLPERVVQMLQEKRPAAQTLLILPPREQFSNIGQLVEVSHDYQADSEEVRAAVRRIDDVLNKQNDEISHINESLQSDIQLEKERSDAAGELRSQLIRLQKVVKVCEHNIKVQNAGVEMLKRAANDSIDSFNANIARTSAKTLPKFTEGRYHKVKIDDDLNVQVFSDEKEGYMDFDEISSGTQRQIMLALRMAMSEELARNTGNEKQFIFLDEPFAFFDQWRTRATLSALPEVSEVISQVWVVAQEFPEDSGVDKTIECPLDEEVLNV